jgi:hypothetical protein
LVSQAFWPRNSGARIGARHAPERCDPLPFARLAPGAGGTGRLERSPGGRFPFASAQVGITADQPLSWNRGYDAAGRQKWGSTASPKLFKRVE